MMNPAITSLSLIDFIASPIDQIALNTVVIGSVGLNAGKS